MNLNPSVVHAIHIAFVAPVLLYAGYTLKQGKPLPTGMPQLMTATGAVVLAFHGYQALQRIQKHQSLATHYGLQANMFHLLLVGPLIAYAGYQRMQQKPLKAWQTTTLMLLGGGALVYHALQWMRP